MLRLEPRIVGHFSNSRYMTIIDLAEVRLASLTAPNSSLLVNTISQAEQAQQSTCARACPRTSTE